MSGRLKNVDGDGPCRQGMAEPDHGPMRIARMRIAFDLDDTLIPGRIPFDVEPLPGSWIRRLFCTESLRLGTVSLFNGLWQQGYDVWVYTTSFRSSVHIWLLFRAYGTRVGGIINEHRHRKRMTRLGDSYKCCTKYPPAFGIDVLVDDCEGVLRESRHFSFEMIRVSPDDPTWTTVVLEYIGADRR
jgi:hypothetical protein